MNLKLYSCNAKRIKLDKTGNMTLIKTIQGTIPDPYNIGMSVTDPEFVIESSGVPSGFNYAEVEELGKYYFVDEPEWVNGNQWRLRLHIDRRMTYKTEIGGTTAYITRYENSDTKEFFTDPLIRPTNRSTESVVVPFEMNNPDTTLRPEGIAQTWKSSNQWGFYQNLGEDTRFLVFFGNQPIGMRKIGGTYGENVWDDFYMNFVVADVKGLRQMANASVIISSVPYALFEKISGIMALPFDWPIDSGYEIEKIKFGGGMISEPTIPKIDSHTHVWRSASIGDFWYAGTGTWKLAYVPDVGIYKTLPYVEYTLRFAPWGDIQLDSTMMANADFIRCYVELSGATGMARLSVRYFEGQYSNPIQIGVQRCGTAQIGLLYPVCNYPAINFQNLLGQGMGVLSATKAGVAAGGYAGGAAAFIGSIAGMALNADSLYTPGTSTSSSGGFIDAEPVLCVQYRGHSDISSSDTGYLYLKSAQISTLTGFCICGDVHITPSANMTNDDVEDIERFLKTEGVIV